MLSSARASALAGSGKAVVVVLHGVSWEELAAAKVPALQDLLRRSAVGAMNSRRLSEPGWDAAYVTIGAGRGAAGFRSGWLEWLSWSDPASGSDVMRRLDQVNARAHTQASPGALGGITRSGDLRTSLLVIGEEFTRNRAVTPAAFIATDRDGRIDRVEWAERGREDAALKRALGRDGLIVIDFADFAFGFTPWPQPDPSALRMLPDVGETLRRIAQQIDPARDLMFLVSPTCPPHRSAKEMSYAPIAIIGPGFWPGLLTSASTRRPGMVSNTDIAPTILRFFRLEAPSAMSGHVISVSRADHPLDRVLSISRQGVRLCDLQWRLGPVYGVSQFAAFMIIGGALILAPAWAARRRRRLQLMLLLAMSLPLALLVLGPLDTGGSVKPYVMLAGLAAAFTWFAFAGAPAITALGALLTATSGIMLADLVTGRHLLDKYILNFGAYGTRFYGLHNESMGALVACGVVGGAALVQQVGQTRRSLWMLGIWLILIPAVIGASLWGANWGGGVTAAFAGTVTYLGIRAQRPRLRHWAAGIGVAAAAGCLAIGLDLIGATRTWSHIGASARLVNAGGWPALWDLIVRKASGNLRVIAWAPYAVIALVLILAVAWLVLRPPARLRAILQSQPILWGSLAGGTAGAVMAVLVNDSGVVAGSTALGIIASSLAYVALEGTRMGAGGHAGPPLQCGGEPL